MVMIHVIGSQCELSAMRARRPNFQSKMSPMLHVDLLHNACRASGTAKLDKVVSLIFASHGETVRELEYPGMGALGHHVRKLSYDDR